MQLFDLPDELLVLCCEHADMLAARALRSSCKRLVPLATKRLFSHVHLLPTTESAKKARAILEDKELMPLVTSISIQASLEEWDCNSDVHPNWDVPDYCAGDPEYAEDAEFGIEINGVLSRTFKDMLADVGLFTNLRRVELTFDWEVTSGGDDDSGNHKEWTEYREPFFKNVLGALNHSDHPAEKVHSLSICNLHDLTNYDIMRSEDFKTVISRLDTLELSIATQEEDACPEREIEIPERHRFFGKDLIEFWLAPTQQNLVGLKIYSNCYWGYLPRCDFRPLHFPRLKRLAFGNMTFTHDSQLDWIVSHEATLESLTLDDCPIVHDAMMYSDLDSERCVKLNDDYTLPSDGEKACWTYPSRWHDFFRKLAAGLPRLHRFGVGHGPWDGGHGEDRATAPFEAAATLPAQLEAARYVIFHGGTGPCPWIEPRAAIDRFGDREGIPEKITVLDQYDSCWDEDDDPPPPSYPDCWDEDQEALDELMKVVERRRAGRHSD